jgi:arsenate reductase
MTEVTIYHNPACGTSRRTLALLRARGIAPRVIEYMKTPPDRATLAGLLAAMGRRPSEMLRRKGPLAGALGLDRPGIGEDAILDALVAHPALLERPIVATAKGVRLGRPPEAVLEILPG